MYSQHSLRTLIYDELKDQVVDQLSTPNIIFLDRRDSPGVPSRVVNRHEISTLVKSAGGITVIPNSLSIPQKIRLFNSPKVIIGEGSGTINALMFGGYQTNFIGLQESESLSNKYFLEGGWPYTHLIAHKSRFLTGQVTQRSFNSPIQSASYSCSHLSHILNSML